MGCENLETNTISKNKFPSSPNKRFRSTGNHNVITRFQELHTKNIKSYTGRQTKKNCMFSQL